MAILIAIVGVLLAKMVIAWLAEAYVYSVPIIGGWMQSLELAELVNVVLFALLGFALGSATQYLSPKTRLWQKLIPLVLILPIVFLSSYWVRQTMWLHQVATTSDLPPAQVTEITDRALENGSGSTGFWGYFRYTTQMPVLPTTAADLERIASDEKWFRSELTRFSGLEPGLFTLVFASTGWGIRIFYIVLSVLTAIIYFSKGVIWAEAARLHRLATR